MSDSTKMNLEELKKSFPALDDFSMEKLLGGGPGQITIEVMVGFSEATGPIFEQVTIPNSPGNPSGGGPTGGPATASAAGSAYFGDYDWGSNSWGDDGMGDGGWGDDDPGGDSNPGGSEGGNGQNSSGNPGNETGEGWWLGGRVWYNESQFVSRPYTLRNDSSNTIYYRLENDSDVHQLAPGEQINQPIEGFKIEGVVYHVNEGYNWVHVGDVGFTTNYVDYWDYMLFLWFGWMLWPPDIYWQPLFDAP